MHFDKNYTTGGALKLRTRRVVLPVADNNLKRLFFPSV